MRKAIVYGAGVSGRSAKILLKKMGYEVILVDDKVGVNSKEAIEILDREKIDLFIKSPGIPYNELVNKCIDKKIELIDEIELSYRYLRSEKKNTKIIAITGTNGKTTTTSKIKEMIEFAGKEVTYAGNIGHPFSTVVAEEKEYEYIVLELSSYQLENLKEFRADIAIVINLAPDHLDRYNKDENRYYDAKFNICDNQTEDDWFILNLEDQEIMARRDRIVSKELTISREEKADICMAHNKLVVSEREIADKKNFSLKGKHNLQNILFMAGVAKILEIKDEILVKFLAETKSLEHRMEEFFKYGKVEFINDSKGTNLESTICAIEAFEKPILICGGKDKQLDLIPLCEVIKEKVKEVYLIGEISDLIENKLKELGYFEVYNLRELDLVIRELKDKLNEDKEETVLFSPASSSFDQFENYIKRGEVYKSLVLETFGK